MCKICAIQNVKKMDLFTDEEIDAHIYNIFSKETTTRNLSKTVYKRIAGKLTDAVYSGYGKGISDVKFNTPDYNMLYELRENVYIFSAAKHYQEVRQISSLLTDGDQINSYNDFKKQAIKIFNTFNDNYLRAEYQSAIMQAQSASQWKDIEANAEAMPWLTYNTVGDSRVRPQHKELDGITRPVNDKFWDKYFPPNDWNCRCDTTQSDEGTKTNLKNFKPSSVPEIFRFNAGKQKIVFSNKHPYYKVAEKDKEFAKVNFNLPLP